MTRTRARSCEGKCRHQTKEAARSELQTLVRKGANGGRLEVYKCRFCGAYHTGHRIGSGGRRR